jgi:undecaprenyl-diphosphatase
MTYLDALILGLVEGLTEFLPISSTAHLMLSRRVLAVEQSEFWKTFLIAIQPGAILAVVLLYWRTLLVRWQVVVRVLVAFVPTAILGYVLYRPVKEFLESDLLALCGLGIGGIVVILFERWHREKPDAEDDLGHITYRQCILIGLLQALAFVPGVSRAAATILGGLALGLKRKAAVEFSFLLAVPTMAAATAYDLYKNAGAFSAEQGQLFAVGFVSSFLFALLAIVFLLRYVGTYSFIPFGVYRIAIAVLGGVILFAQT